MAGMGLSGEYANQPSRDEKFLRKLNGIIKTNLLNEQFGVELLARDMGMSRSQLFRTIRKLTGKNVSQYIREFRLQKAMELLKNDVASVAEIAYRTGFGSPEYFNRCFNQYYGYPPGEVLRKFPEDQQKIEDKREDEEIPVQTKKRIIFDRYGLYALIILAGIILVIIGIGYYKKINRIIPPGSATEKTIAILPFKNESPDPGNDYICQSIQEEIINQLRKIGELIIRSRQSIEQFSYRQKDVFTTSPYAAYYLEGSLWQSGDSIRLLIRLIDSGTNNQIWGEPYSLLYNPEAISDVQEQIASRVVTSLGIVLTPEEKRKIGSRKVVGLEALRSLMKGRQEMNNFWDGLGRHHADTAMDIYNKVLEAEPEFAFAVASKGEVFFHRDNNLDSAIYYCQKAIELDPEEGYGYWVLANCYQKMELPDLAIENFLKTIELYPNVPGPHANLGCLYIMYKQDVLKGLPYLKRSVELAPFRELTHLVASRCYFDIGDYEKAIEYSVNTINYGEIFTCDGIQQYYLTLIAGNKIREGLTFLDSISALTDCENICHKGYWFLNLNMENYNQAEKEYNLLAETGNSFILYDSIFLAFMYKKLDSSEKYLETINHCQKRCEDMWRNNKESFVNIENMISLYAVLDEKERVLFYLSELEKSGFHFNVFDFIEVTPVFENFRNDREFQVILRRVHEKKVALWAQIQTYVSQ